MCRLRGRAEAGTGSRRVGGRGSVGVRLAVFLTAGVAHGVQLTGRSGPRDSLEDIWFGLVLESAQAAVTEVCVVGDGVDGQDIKVDSVVDAAEATVADVAIGELFSHLVVNFISNMTVTTGGRSHTWSLITAPYLHAVDKQAGSTSG